MFRLVGGFVLATPGAKNGASIASTQKACGLARGVAEMIQIEAVCVPRPRPAVGGGGKMSPRNGRMVRPWRSESGPP